MKKIKLGDVCKIIKGEYITQKNSNPGKYPVVLGGTQPAYFIDKFNHVGEAIVISRSGASAGYVSFWNEPIFVTDGFLIETNDEVDYKFIYNFLKYRQKKITGSKKGTTIPHITPRTIFDIEIDLPPLEIQKKIGNFLYSLDEKISLNKKINATLEAMAKTLYDYWFVQFDFPNEHGRPYKSSGGKMVYSSELGREIPKGWTVATLGDLITENATPFNSQTAEPTIDLSVMPSASISLDRLNISSMFSINLFKMTEGDILFGSIRPYLKKAGIAPCDGVVVGTVHSYRAKKESDYTFALFTICHDNFFDYAVKVSTGTRMPIISSESLLSYKVAYSENIAKIFNMPDLRRTICKNVQESQRLAELRDWLLPLLMNGQVNCK